MARERGGSVVDRGASVVGRAEEHERDLGATVCGTFVAVLFIRYSVVQQLLSVDEDASSLVHKVQVRGMCVHTQEVPGARTVVKDRKKAHAMEEEILSRGKANHTVTLEP